jgi:cell division protein FtsZ
MINLSMADPEHNLRPRLTVMGIGGAGGNAINNMIRCHLEGCDFIAANTDSQALSLSLAPRKIQLGMNMSRGLGAGSKPDMGRAAAEEQIADIMACLEGSDMLFVTAGMGGGTGTGAAPVIARAARESGILTVGVVTKPFHFEGNNRMRMAEGGIAELQQYVDTLIVIPNQNLFRIANERTTFAEAFRLADEVLHSGVRGITDLMVMPGFMNLDFADVKTVMGEMGKAMMGTGEASGDNRAIQAAEAAISNPLLDDVSMKGARGVLINITGGMDMTLFEVDQAANRIREEVDPEAQIKVGSTLGEDLDGRIRVSVIATGIDASIVVSQRTSAASGAGTGTGSGGLRSTQQPAPIEKKSAISYGPAVTTTSPTAYQTAASQQAVIAQTVTPSVSGQTNYFTMPQAMTPQILARQTSAPPQQQVAPQVEQAFERQPDVQVVSVQPMSSESEASAHEQHSGAQASHTAQLRQDSSRQESQGSPARYAPQPYSPKTSAGPMSPANAPRRADASVQQASPAHAPFDMRVTQLTTPAQQAAADTRRARRSESLFTRITGFGLVRPSTQQQDEQVNETLPDDQSAAQAQSRLSIDPSDRPNLSSDQTEDMLDIPAFLRRQTNH